ncbi:MAG: PPC domain-containing protein, partial [Amphritea sp.]|nr:PPC domain-containing protein [Amphritea sp.]
MCEICMATSTFDPARHPGAGPIPEFALVFETADAPANITTTYSMNVGDTFSGRLSSSTDADWVAVTLTAGERYQIDLEGRTLSDPYLYLYDGNGRLISVNDDGGAGRDSQITYTATSTGTYYLRADA